MPNVWRSFGAAWRTCAKQRFLTSNVNSPKCENRPTEDKTKIIPKSDPFSNFLNISINGYSTFDAILIQMLFISLSFKPAYKNNTFASKYCSGSRQAFDILSAIIHVH